MRAKTKIVMFVSLAGDMGVQPHARQRREVVQIITRLLGSDDTHYYLKDDITS